MESKLIKIAPSILTADFAALGDAVRLMEKCGADYIHCDVMDGVFVPNITFGIKAIADIRAITSLPLDLHLMIVNPQNYVKKFIDAGADIVTVHIEAVDFPRDVLENIRKLGAKGGLVLSPDTPAEAVFPYLDFVDIILVMSVYPGFGGQKFIPTALAKLEIIKEEIEKRGLDVDLEIDGGITIDNISAVKKAGANIIVAGNTIFSSSEPATVIAKLRG